MPIKEIELKPDDIIKLRKKLDISQEELAHRIGLRNYHTIMLWEKGLFKPSHIAMQSLLKIMESVKPKRNKAQPKSSRSAAKAK